MKTTIEFYDLHGLLLHSGKYEPRVSEHIGRTLPEIHTKGQAALDVFGYLYPRAKSVTLRVDVPGKLFPVTLECHNPHHKPAP